MISNLTESFWDWCRLNIISTVLKLFAEFVEFLWFPSFSFWVQGSIGFKITEDLYFINYKAEMHGNLLYDHYFNFLSVKNGVSKNDLS